MRLPLRSIAMWCVLVGAWHTSPAQGDRSARVAQRSPDGQTVAEVRARGGGDAVFVDGKLAWPTTTRKKTRVILAPRWARAGHALALLAREAGETRLVVVLVRGEGAGQALEWPLPPAALPARAIMWLDATHVAVGPREMEPRLVASFDVR